MEGWGWDGGREATKLGPKLSNQNCPSEFLPLDLEGAWQTLSDGGSLGP